MLRGAGATQLVQVIEQPVQQEKPAAAQEVLPEASGIPLQSHKPDTVQPEEPAPATELPLRAPYLLSDPSFRLPEGTDPLSAVLLQKQPDQAPSEDNSASDDGKDMAQAINSAPAMSSPSASQGSGALPPPPALPAAAPGTAHGAAPASSAPASPALPKLAPPPWAAAGAHCKTSRGGK